jgi:hypothetical protein
MACLSKELHRQQDFVGSVAKSAIEGRCLLVRKCTEARVAALARLQYGQGCPAHGRFVLPIVDSPCLSTQLR